MPSKDTTTVRVRRPDSQRLRSLANDQETTVIEVVHRAIDALERREFLRGLNDDFRRLHADRELWQAYLDEHREWDELG
jgi:hypothetical protein